MIEVYFIYTNAVAEFVRENDFDRKDIQDTVSAEMKQLQADGLKNPLSLIMHVFTWEGQDFIITPGQLDSGKDVLFVDLCEYVEGPVLTEGPFAEMTVKIPSPFSEVSSKKATRH